MGVRAGSTGAAASGVTHDAPPCQRTAMPVVHRRQRVRHQPSADFVLPRARLTGKPVAAIRQYERAQFSPRDQTKWRFG